MSVNIAIQQILESMKEKEEDERKVGSSLGLRGEPSGVRGQLGAEVF